MQENENRYSALPKLKPDFVLLKLDFRCMKSSFSNFLFANNKIIIPKEKL